MEDLVVFQNIICRKYFLCKKIAHARCSFALIVNIYKKLKKITMADMDPQHFIKTVLIGELGQLKGNLITKSNEQFTTFCFNGTTA